MLRSAHSQGWVGAGSTSDVSKDIECLKLCVNSIYQDKPKQTKTMVLIPSRRFTCHCRGTRDMSVWMFDLSDVVCGLAVAGLWAYCALRSQHYLLLCTSMLHCPEFSLVPTSQLSLYRTQQPHGCKCKH